MAKPKQPAKKAAAAAKTPTKKAKPAAPALAVTTCERDEDGLGCLPFVEHDADQVITQQQVSVTKAMLLAAGFESLELTLREDLRDGNVDDAGAIADEWDNDASLTRWRPEASPLAAGEGWILVAVLEVDDSDPRDAVALFARKPVTARQDWPFPKGKEGESGPEAKSDPGYTVIEDDFLPAAASPAPTPQRIPGRLQFITPQLLMLKHINVRNESHGKAKVDAIDLDFQLEGMNADVLDLLQAGLCECLYHNPEAENGQEPVPGVRQVLPKKRFPKLEQLPWSIELTGVDLTVIYGTGRDESNIEFTDGKAVTKRAELKEGGTVLLFFRYSTCNIPDGAIDKLRKKLDQLVEVTLVQQEKLRQQAIDGTVGHPGASAPLDDRDAGDLFTEAHGRDGEGASQEPAPDGNDEREPAEEQAS